MKKLAAHFLCLFGLLLTAGSALAEVPTVRTISPPGMQRGTSVEVELFGEEISDVQQVVFYSPGLEAKDFKVVDKRKVKMTVVADEKAECDLHAFRLITKNGISNLRLFSVSPLPNIDEAEDKNNTFDEPQLIKLNTTVNGIVQSEDVDYFAVEVPQGELISVEMEGLRHNYLNNMFDPYVAVYDAQGTLLTECDDAPLIQQDSVCGVVAPAPGRYVIEVRDASYGGSRESAYRVHVGNFARPIAIYPSGGRPGENLKATCVDAAGNTWEENFQLPNQADPRFKVWSSRGKVSPPSPNFLRVTSYEGTLEQEPNNNAKEYQGLPVVESFPVAMNGCLQAPGDQDWFVFAAKKDQSLEFRLIARSVIRSPLDGVVEVHKFDGGRLASNDDSGGGPDAAFSFKAPADGKYAVCVKDHLNKGGPHFTYRLEIEPPAPKLITTIKEQERYISQTIPVPRGARMAVDVLLERKFVGGNAEIVIPDLPPGMEQLKAVVAENSNHVQLMLRAKADAANVGKLVDLSARLQKDGDKEMLIGHMDQRTQIVRGQNNRDVWGINSDKLAVAILDPIGFDIEVVQPQVPLVRDGTMPLIVKAKRQPGFTRSIRLKVLDTPPGITASTSISIPEGQDQVELPLTSNGKAAIGKWPITVLATSKVAENNTVTIASEFVEVEVADKLFEFEFAKTMAELGKPAKVAIGVNLNREVEGKVEVEVVGLPPGTTMEASKLPLAKDAKRLTYVLSIPAGAKPGVFKTIACRGTVTSDKGVITQINGTGEVQIDTPRNAPAKTGAKEAEADKPLSRLEELRKQREGSQ